MISRCLDGSALGRLVRGPWIARRPHERALGQLKVSLSDKLTGGWVSKIPTIKAASSGLHPYRDLHVHPQTWEPAYMHTKRKENFVARIPTPPKQVCSFLCSGFCGTVPEILVAPMYFIQNHRTHSYTVSSLLTAEWLPTPSLLLGDE